MIYYTHLQMEIGSRNFKGSQSLSGLPEWGRNSSFSFFTSDHLITEKNPTVNVHL